MGGHFPSCCRTPRPACLHSALQSCKLLYEMPPSPLLEKRKFVHSKMKQPFIDSQPRFLLPQAACQGPGGTKRTLSASPGPSLGGWVGGLWLPSPWGLFNFLACGLLSGGCLTGLMGLLHGSQGWTGRGAAGICFFPFHSWLHFAWQLHGPLGSCQLAYRFG